LYSNTSYGRIPLAGLILASSSILSTLKEVEGLKKIVCENYEESCRVAADIFAEQLKQKPDSVLGLATGSTPVGLYDELVLRSKAGAMDFTHARSFNLDEYYPISVSHPQSYNTFMEKHLFSKVKFASSRLPSGEAADPHIECAEYDAAIEAAGGIDLQLLGIGLNGHIGFNEPALTYPMGSNLVELSSSTLEANSRFFSENEAQPTTALTMGIGQILAARHILLLISGASKVAITKKLFDKKLYTDIPACFLLLHPNVTLVIDKAAAGA
jgi:glucosamine-6-phosphate deaminase